MNKKHEETLNSIFTDPILSNIKMNKVENLLSHLGAVVNTHGVTFKAYLNDSILTITKPSQKEICPCTVKRLRIFLSNAGYEPEWYRKPPMV
jgi:hypothetical protein